MIISMHSLFIITLFCLWLVSKYNTNKKPAQSLNVRKISVQYLCWNEKNATSFITFDSLAASPATQLPIMHKQRLQTPYSLVKWCPSLAAAWALMRYTRPETKHHKTDEGCPRPKKKSKKKTKTSVLGPYLRFARSSAHLFFHWKISKIKKLRKKRL
jgi:transposase